MRITEKILDEALDYLKECGPMTTESMTVYLNQKHNGHFTSTNIGQMIRMLSVKGLVQKVGLTHTSNRKTIWGLSK